MKIFNDQKLLTYSWLLFNIITVKVEVFPVPVDKLLHNLFINYCRLRIEMSLFGYEIFATEKRPIKQLFIMKLQYVIEESEKNEEA